VEASRWQLHTLGDDGSVRVFAGFDAVLLAPPPAQAADVLERSRLAPSFVGRLRGVQVAPCWSLMLALPQAATALGPAWNAAFSAHHRVAWLARDITAAAQSGIGERVAAHTQRVQRLLIEPAADGAAQVRTAAAIGALTHPFTALPDVDLGVLRDTIVTASLGALGAEECSTLEKAGGHRARR